jgi:hypothetical protein
MAGSAFSSNMEQSTIDAAISAIALLPMRVEVGD